LNAMLDFILIGFLLIGIIVGLRRGFILQLIHMTGFIVAFIVAAMNYNELAGKLVLWVPFPSMGDSSSLTMLFNHLDIENAYYNAIAFLIIFFAVKIIWQIIGSMLDFIAQFPILNLLNRWGGGILGLLETYLIMFILLYLAALLPIQIVQEQIQGSVMAKSIITNTPFFSEKVKDLWFHYMSAFLG